MNRLLQITPPAFFPFLIVAFIYTIYYTFIRRKAKNFNLYIIHLAVIYYFLVLYVLVRPYNLRGNLNSLFDYPIKRYLNYIPLVGIAHVIQRKLWVQVIGNLILLAPIPIFINLLFNKKSLKITILSSLCISVIIESYQFIFNIVVKAPNGVTDIDDIILNVLGAILSFVLLTLFLKLKHRIISCRMSSKDTNI